jgi:hypothetical protein
MATDVPPVQFSFARAFGIIQMLPPNCHLSAQPVEIESGKRAVRAVEITHGTLQNRARTHMVAFGVVMKSDRQLNYTLQVPAQRTMTGRLTPGVFEDLVGVEEVGGVEEGDATKEVVFMHLS